MFNQLMILVVITDVDNRDGVVVVYVAYLTQAVLTGDVDDVLLTIVGAVIHDGGAFEEIDGDMISNFMLFDY